MGSAFIDLIGQVFGKWTVLKRLPNNKWGKAMYLCHCECGKEKPVHARSLKNGSSTRCRQCRGIRDRLPDGVAGQHNYVLGYKRSAKKRGYTWALTDEEALALAVQDCHYCGAVPSNISWRSSSDERARTAFTNNGIDRIDNAKGYVLGNVVSCCYMCNISKRDWPLDIWCDWLARIAARYSHAANDNSLEPQTLRDACNISSS